MDPSTPNPHDHQASENGPDESASSGAESPEEGAAAEQTAEDAVIDD